MKIESKEGRIKVTVDPKSQPANERIHDFCKCVEWLKTFRIMFTLALNQETMTLDLVTNKGVRASLPITEDDYVVLEKMVKADVVCEKLYNQGPGCTFSMAA